VLTDAYIVCAFAALLAPTVEQKWSWVFVCLSTVALSVCATAKVVREASGQKTCYVWLLQGFFFVYGIVYLSAATSRISIVFEIVSFGLMDIATKGIFSSCMFQKRLEDVYKAGWLIGRYLTASPAQGVEHEKQRIIGIYPDSDDWLPSERQGDLKDERYEHASEPHFSRVSPVHSTSSRATV
jgi:hypothetical protein